MKRMTLIIFGDVQGVNFRSFVYTHARKLGLVGWVRNNADGAVGVLAEGEEQELHELKRLCEHGPSDARVERVEEIWEVVGALSYKSFNMSYAE